MQSMHPPCLRMAGVLQYVFIYIRNFYFEALFLIPISQRTHLIRNLLFLYCTVHAPSIFARLAGCIAWLLSSGLRPHIISPAMYQPPSPWQIFMCIYNAIPCISFLLWFRVTLGFRAVKVRALANWLCVYTLFWNYLELAFDLVTFCDIWNFNDL